MRSRKIFSTLLLSVIAATGTVPAFAQARGGGGAPAVIGPGPTSGSFGVGPAGPVGNSSFVQFTPAGTIQGVGPAGPIGNASTIFIGAGRVATNGNVGLGFNGSPASDLNAINNGSGNFGFATQGFGFGLGIGWTPTQVIIDDSLNERELRRLKALMSRSERPNAPNVAVPVNTLVQRRGNRVVAVKESLVNGKIVRSEGTIVQEYPSSRLATRTRTFARTYRR